jgi:transposase
METGRQIPPDEVATLKEALLRVEAELAVARAKAADDLAVIAHQKVQIAKLYRALYGPHAERSKRLIDQMELAFEELAASATADEIAAEQAVAKTTNAVAFTRQRPSNEFPPRPWTLSDGRICMSNNAAERALRGIALGRNYAQPGIMRSSLAAPQITAVPPGGCVAHN